MKKNFKKQEISHTSFNYYSPKKIPKRNNKIILKDSDSESEEEPSRNLYLHKSPIKNIKNKNEEQNFLGKKKYNTNNSKDVQKNNINRYEPSKNINNYNNYTGYKSPKKLRHSSFLKDSESNSPQRVSRNNQNNSIITEKINSNDSQNSFIFLKDDEDMVVFPYEYTTKIIDALSCEYCKGIYLKPYVINLPTCMHIFCLGCIMKMIEDKEIGICQKCNTQFVLNNIKYSEVIDYYVKAFFPQIPKIIESNNKILNDYMEAESRNHPEIVNAEEEKKIVLKCFLKSLKNNKVKNKLPDISQKHNKIMVEVKSENENIVSVLKRQIIRRLNAKLKEDELKINCNGVELSQFKTYKLLKNFLKPNKNGLITIEYSNK